MSGGAEGQRQKAEGVPQGWRELKFKDVILLSQYGITATASENGNYPMFKMNSFQSGKMLSENLDMIEISDDEFAKYKLEKGDILFNRTNSIDLVGKTGIFDLDGDYVFASYLVRFRIDAAIGFPNYINYFMNWDRSKAKLKDIATKGVSQANINPTTLGNFFTFLLPPLPEQRKIAAILSTWDDALATLTNLLAAKRQQKRGLAEALLTGKKRLPGFAGEWEETRLGRHVFEFSQRNKNSSIERVLSVTNHSGFVLPEEQFSKRVASENISNYKVVRRGQFAYNPSRLNVGSLARLDNFSEGVVSPLYVVFDVVDSLDRNYLLYWLESPLAESKIKASVQGSVRDSVSFNALSSFAISLPPLPEQQAIASVLSTLDAEIASLEALRGKVQEQKRGLMDELLTGRVRVAVEEAC